MKTPCNSIRQWLTSKPWLKQIQLLLIVSLFAANGQAGLPAHLSNAEEKGLYIAQETDRRNTGWGDSSARMIMVLKNRAGATSERDMRLITLEMTNDGDKSISIFDTPRDIQGTAFLTHSHALVADDQWMFLPSLKRVKRISSKNKSGPFMGSTFAFEDLSSFEIEKYSYKYLRDETLEGGIQTYVSELVPTYKYSGYTKMISWIDQDEFRVRKTEYYDRKGALLKTQTFLDYQQYLGKFWRAHRNEMINHQTGKSTDLIWSEYKFDVGLSNRDFDKNGLKRFK